ncbi:MAG: class I SAM-dependent methyltransferase [Deltaproteobacteria bacterium]|nr:class I SAM-dependent methyltransferase [Deltaproteobacteria bacterium]
MTTTAPVKKSNFFKLLYYIIRSRTAPFEKVLKYIPDNANILDIGCGYGILIDLINAKKDNCKIIGIDIDHKRIKELQKAYPHNNFIAGDALAEAKKLLVGKRTFDCIIIFDVIYLFKHEKQKELIRIASELLKPSGIFLIKEIDTEAGLRFLFSYLQELFSVKIVKMTKGDGLHFMSKEAISKELYKNNLNTEIIRMGSILHPHTLIIGKKY